MTQGTESQPSQASPPAPTFNQNRAYPAKLQDCEARAIETRRAAAKVPTLGPKALPKEELKLPPNTVGLALSGGGIRSATFSLGVLQNMAKHRLLSHVDFLSTVSGGGFTGGFWCGWLNRLQKPSAEPKKPDPWLGSDLDEAQEKLADSSSAQVSWLRENGRYLAPNGADDAWLAATVYQRNFVTLHLVLAPLFLAVFTFIAASGTSVPMKLDGFSLQSLATVHRYTLGPHLIVVTNAWLWSLASIFLGLALIMGALFWFTGQGVLNLLGVLGSVDVWRNRWTRYQALLMQFFAVTLCVAALDTLGGSLFESLIELIKNNPRVTWGSVGTALAALIAASRKIKALLSQPASQDKPLAGPSFWIPVAAVVLVSLWLVGFATLGHAAALLAPKGHFRYSVDPLWTLFLPYVPALVMLAIGFVIGFLTSILNRSGLADLYAARLTRAYLGASNEARVKKPDITETIPGDQIEFASYFPHQRGGPLHLINVTVNETLDPQSAVTRSDRKGVPMAVGPCGISVGVRHHTTWVEEGGRRTGAVSPILEGSGEHQAFHLFATTEPDNPRVGELTLGRWIGVSGAAFSTGLGAKTSLPMSFLLGFFNVRLGWWWDSGVKPGKRTNASQRPANRLMGDIILDTLFKLQFYLLNEFTAHFHGTARKDWYLTDGGHFENTAAYELIRRRVPLILICDDGCDAPRNGEDFANLVRKARIDFMADIEVINPAMSAGFPADLLKVVGTLDEVFTPVRTGTVAKCALMAWVNYPDKAGRSLLVLIKPTVCGDESAAERNYSIENPDFPQQSTLNQFFGEDQWESYRALGEGIADKIFVDATGTARALTPLALVGQKA